MNSQTKFPEDPIKFPKKFKQHKPQQSKNNRFIGNAKFLRKGPSQGQTTKMGEMFSFDLNSRNYLFPINEIHFAVLIYYPFPWNYRHNYSA